LLHTPILAHYPLLDWADSILRHRQGLDELIHIFMGKLSNCFTNVTLYLLSQRES